MIVYHYDAFTHVQNQGNPAGVVFDADDLDESTMLQIARQVGFNETVFVQSSSVATVRLRYFTPGHEINLCGHATMAAIYGLRTRGYLNPVPEITIETKAGILPVALMVESSDLLTIRMQQSEPQFVPFEGDKERLMHAIGLSLEDLDLRYPIVYGSTGTWTLLIPIRTLSAFGNMRPESSQFPVLLTEMPRASIHPFGLETAHPESMMHARHFSSPYSGTIEDPVTGTASGVMGAYYMTYIQPGLERLSFQVEQGHELLRDGRVQVDVRRTGQGMSVHVSGNAVFVKELSVVL
ncbi:PhzF family phenazine biosynthesis protein [Paenibacillus sp. 1011MAR3C5]|uniref:PhzF family phenazine biosynthesis protein n=1 Tax=Paenibacillus sp. 1011MAR3C5 TaxID=1675787 RepID=UPI00268B31B3|nr:PhzF family phenazine biosynthesis protein [Paenibacillus sp. 1011MAR3C5]